MSLTNEQKYNKIVEWLYKNDGQFNSRSEWRSKFLIFLQSILVDSHSLLEEIKGKLDKIDDRKNIHPCRCNEIPMEKLYQTGGSWGNSFCGHMGGPGEKREIIVPVSNCDKKPTEKAYDPLTFWPDFWQKIFNQQ